MFSDRLRALRTECGLTQAQVVEELLHKQQIEIKLQSYSTYENGREPSYSLLSALARYFNVSTDYLIGNTDARNPENTDVMIKFGLSEEAIERLLICKKLQFSDTASELIGHHLFVQLIQLIRGLEYTRKNYSFGPDEANAAIDAMLDKYSRTPKNPLSKWFASSDDLIAISKFRCQGKFEAIIEDITNNR